MQPHGAVFPLVRTPTVATMSSLEMLDWIKNNQAKIRQDMQTHGAVLLRGFPVNAPEDFSDALGRR